MNVQKEAQSPVTVFISYAPADEALQQKLVKHLSNLQRQGLLTTWYDRKIVAGTDRNEAVDQHLTQASLILLLISADFLASDYCYSNEMQRALELHERGLALVIPIILRPVDWRDAPFAHLQSLPRGGKSLTQWRNSDKAFLDVVSDIRLAIEQLQFPLTLPETLSLSFHKYIPASTNPDRRTMLERVWNIWIENFLDQSFHHAVLIALGLREQPEAVANPWRLAVQEMAQPERPLPAGTPITQVYYDANRSLLILGEPGCGKTTVLLQLARHLLLQAGRDEKQPMPVVLNLSSWSMKQLPLTEWLVEELQLKYQVPPRLSRSWITNNMLQLLLDGLDEVDESSRAACIKAINAYRKEHGFTPIVVCSRKAEYFAHQELLALQSAIVVQPLTEAQITAYLHSMGQELEALQQVLSEKQELRELAQTPLMLSVMTLAYQGKSVQDIQGTDPTTAGQQVFALYIERVLHRRGQETYYSPEQTLGWLGWLARQMHQQNQSELYLEQMQPDWLPPGWIRRLYPWTVRCTIALVSGLTVGLVVPLGSLLLNLSAPGFISLFSFPAFMATGLMVGFLLGLLSPIPKNIEPAEVITWSISSVWRSLTSAASLRSTLIGGFITGGIVFFASLKIDPHDVLLATIIVGLIVATLSGYTTGAVSRTSKEYTPKTPEKKHQRSWWQHILSGLLFRLNMGLIVGCMTSIIGFFLALVGFTGISRLSISAGITVGLLASLVWGFIAGLSCVLSIHPPREIQTVRAAGWLWLHSWSRLIRVRWITGGLAYGLFISLLSLDLGPLLGIFAFFIGIVLTPVFGLVSGILDEMISGLTSQALEKNTRIRPNQGIWQSGRNSLFIGLTFGALGGLLFGLLGMLLVYAIEPSSSFSFMLLVALFMGIPGGIISGLAVALLYGGTAYLQHGVLRLLLWSISAIPKNYPRFLNYAHSRILLRKIGGGYTFIHHQFLDYFTTRNEEIPHFSPKCGLRLQLLLLMLSIILIASITGLASYLFLFPPSNLTDTVRKAHPYPSYLPGHGTLIFYDTLDYPNNNWSVGSNPAIGGDCRFSGDVLSVSLTKKSSPYLCPGNGMTFGDIAFEVQMTISKGDCGGIALRFDTTAGTGYILVICRDGNYAFVKSTDFSKSTVLLQGSYPAIHAGLGQSNVITALAIGNNFVLFINGQKINTTRDSSYNALYADGTIGMLAASEYNPTQVVYRDACVWQYNS